MNLSRTSGVQLHPTSLPGGRLGPEAYAWVDWLAAAGQSWWQMLPLGPPDEHGSPYKSASAFAASPALLADPAAPVSRAEALDVPRAGRRTGSRTGSRSPGFGALDDQVRFDREWAALRRYALDRGVRLIGDVPIYVAEGSADTLAHPEIFRDGVVAGVPPDAFTDKGQLWGNPVYDWPALRRSGYAWWIARFRRVFELFDLARIDHFRGFVAYWGVPASAEFALEGAWKRGPGRAPFDAARAALGELPLIAEDLGVITPPVKQLRDVARPARAWPCCSSASRRPSATPSTCSRTTWRTRSSTPARTTTTRSAPGSRASRTASARCSTRRSRARASPTPSRTGR